ncbi:MAG: flavodoxin family protein [Desulfobacterales bacterium]|nr:flavodoxin family protein [Desulfobacterales bacterium]
MDVIGISGSPIPKSNTDRIIRHILDHAGESREFIKLSTIQVRPCLGCKQCVEDNICKVKDDFPALAEKIKRAKALVIGAYTPYSQIDAFTKALLERFWSLRHVTHLLKGKLGATVVTGLTAPVTEMVSQAMAGEMAGYEGMELVGQIRVQGNLPCVTCGRGDDCPQSAKPLLHGADIPCSDIPYADVQNNDALWRQAEEIGKKIKAGLNS